MNNIFYIVLLIGLLASCSKRLTPGVNTVIKEVITVDTVYVPKDSLIILPGDSVYLVDEIPCPELDYFKEKTSKSGKVKTTVTISKGTLTVDCKTDSLQARIKWLEAQVKQVSVKEITTTITLPPKRFIPKWVWWLLGINIIYIAARVLFTVYKIPIRI